MIWIGEIGRSGGFADAGRNYLAALATVGYTNARPYLGAIGWGTDPDLKEDGPFGVLARTYRDRNPVGVTTNPVVIHHFPTEVHRFVVRERRNIAMTAWETSGLSTDARHLLNTLIDEVWVPSEHNAEVMRSSGVTVPVVVMPHCHGPWTLPSVKVPYWAKGRYVFYYIGADNPRKNPQAVLRAYLREFRHDEPVALVYKVWSDVLWSQKDQAAARVPVADRVRAVMKELGIEHGPTVVALWGNAPLSDILRIHAWSDCYVSAHRGEAWGLAMSQAKWFGRKVIATGWSGPVDYLDPKVDDLLPYSLVDVDPTVFGYRPGFKIEQQWAEVEQDALRAAMRQAYERRAVGSAEGMERFSWEVVGHKMARRLEALEATP